jgi:hypothetical protein
MAQQISKQATRVAFTLFGILIATASHAQQRSNWIGPVGVEADWDEGEMAQGEGINWDTLGFNFQPSSTFGDGEYASISNGGIALIDHPITIFPTDIRIGQDASTTGTLSIRSGGSISVTPGNLGTGTIANGGAGAGTLIIRSDMGAVQARSYSQAANSTLVAQFGSANSFTSRLQLANQVTLGGTLRLEPTPSRDSRFRQATPGHSSRAQPLWVTFQTSSSTRRSLAMKGNASSFRPRATLFHSALANALSHRLIDSRAHSS